MNDCRESIPFLRLARKYFRSDLWQEDREFSRAEAWLDMIQTASYTSEARLVESRCVNLQRGELVASLRYLAQRWRWSRTRVDRFLNGLVEAKRVTFRDTNGTGARVITLCNFESYNPTRDACGTDTSPPTRPGAGHQRDKVEEGKEGKEGGVVRAREAQIPDRQEAIARTAPAGIDPEFAGYVWDDWSGRDGKDAAGNPRDWLPYVKIRWERERREWTDGTHKGNKHGPSTNPKGAGNRNEGIAGVAEYQRALAAKLQRDEAKRKLAKQMASPGTVAPAD